VARRGDIGIALSEKFPETDPLTVRFTDLHRYVIGLPEFTDDPKSAGNEKLLEAIQMRGSMSTAIADRLPGQRPRSASNTASRSRSYDHSPGTRCTATPAAGPARRRRAGARRWTASPGGELALDCGPRKRGIAVP